ncbi:alpha/beta-hydrolase [Viridothelium virens]|uniref:Carboxylic ester hydrolase n=1 Tax=Viridothelium virens TaxID=1048519 RepID=A0A6A6H6T3_VIRVR|nr:alpha/beta-hydrolase [Viridothelium virens]
MQLHPSLITVLCTLAPLVATSPSRRTDSSPLPTVNLGYQIQQASGFNSSFSYYNFSNIRYAAPPLGNLRFAAPEAPARNSTINNGLDSRICPQAVPTWLSTELPFIGQYLLTGNTTPPATSPSSGVPPAVDPRTNEDCLFLDVLVPQDIFESRNSSRGAPVLVWIYGGGYTEGSKDGSGDAAGLVARSRIGNSGVVFVELNYRLGALGWLSGPTFQKDGSANAGLLDQRFALEWVQQHIHKFGGDPKKVTVIGESAGGGSIMHQITAYGGLKGRVPFQQAIPQSPGFFPLYSNNQQEQTFQDFLSLLNVSTLQQARQLPSSALIQANTLQIANSSYGQFTYGPAVDGDFVPALPGVLLLHGQYDKSIRVMPGHNTDEGLLFTSPYVQNDEQFREYATTSFPGVSAAVIDYVTGTLYPPIFDGTYNYTNQLQRTALLISEAVFTCNAYWLNEAFRNQTFSYLFSVYPGIHGEDVAYTFFDGQTGPIILEDVGNATFAKEFQEYLTNFAETGNPNGDGLPQFPMYGKDATVQVLNLTASLAPSISQTTDPAANYRCDWWQKALYS